MGLPQIVSPLSEKMIGIISCPISQEIMQDPVCTPSGDTYERSEIVKWITSHHTCPFTRHPLQIKDLVPNKSLKNSIEGHIRSGRLPPFPQKTEESSDPSKLTQVSPTTRYVFGNPTTVRIPSNVRLPHIQSSSFNTDPLATVDIPPNPNFDFIPCEHTRHMVCTAYKAVHDMDEWDFIRRYNPSVSTGYVSDTNNRINAIQDRIDQEYQGGHSGGSMGGTMRIIQFIAKNGLNAFIQTYQ
jgi:hypothetical protein